MMEAQCAGSAAPLEAQLNELIAHFDVLYRRLMVTRPASAASDVEVSRQEIRMVTALGKKGTTIMSDLARALNLALSTATNTVDKLVSKDLVERTRVDEDRRIVQVALSEKGKRYHEACLEWQLAMGRNMLDALSPGEREIFLELMAKMTRPGEATIETELAHSAD